MSEGKCVLLKESAYYWRKVSTSEGKWVEVKESECKWRKVLQANVKLWFCHSDHATPCSFSLIIRGTGRTLAQHSPRAFHVSVEVPSVDMVADSKGFAFVFAPFLEWVHPIAGVLQLVLRRDETPTPPSLLGPFHGETPPTLPEVEWCKWNKSYVNCGYEIKWRMILAVMIAIFAIA